MRQRIRILVNISVLFISLIVTFFILEILTRTYHLFYKGVPFSESVGFWYNQELGWEGKRIFGNPVTQKHKIFFIGDSFTDGCGIKEEYMYYSVVKKNLDAEIFVYGGAGYGTLQEYLILNKYIDYIKPDLIVLQVCANDFISNSQKLERASSHNYNQSWIRPYLINGKIKSNFPLFLNRPIIFLISHSRFFYILATRIDKLFTATSKKRLLHSAEEIIQKEGMKFADFKEAVSITNELVIKIKNRAGKIPVIAFAIDKAQPYFRQFKKIFQENQIMFIEDVPNAIRQEENEGIKVRLSDKVHFNEIGNQICGEVLTDLFLKRQHEKERQDVQTLQ